MRLKATRLSLSALAIVALTACGAVSSPSEEYGTRRSQPPSTETDTRPQHEALNEVRQAVGDAMSAAGFTGQIIYSYGATQIIIKVHSDTREITDEDIAELRETVERVLPIEALVVIEIVDAPALRG